MKAIGLCLALVLVLAISGCAATGSSIGDALGDAQSSEHRILVMLHLPPQHFRPLADYGGGYMDVSGQAARRRIAASLAREHGLKTVSDWPMPVLGLHCFVMEVPEQASPAAAAELVARDHRVKWAQPVQLFHAMGNGDPLYTLQPSARLWHLAEIHKTATGRSVRIAVVDSGVDADHPDLAGQVVLKENFVEGTAYAAEAHGTAVAGIIAARAGNGIGIAGVAPGARLLALRACWENAMKPARCNSFTLAKALHSAILHGAQIINLSLSGAPDRLMRGLLDEAQARGIKLVAAADPKSKDGGFPASHGGVLAVTDGSTPAGMTREARILSAPGRDIPATVPAGRWGFVSGPSFAASHISGLVALITELQPTLSADLIQQALADEPNGIGATGYVDACMALSRVTRFCSCACVAPQAAADSGS